MTTAAQDVMLSDMATRKNAAAVALGRRRAATAAPGEMSEIGKVGGVAGGPGRAESLSAKRRREIAKNAAAARWAKKSKG
jgi:hypothetical protein